MTDVSRLLWECADNTKQIVELKEQVKELTQQISELRNKIGQDQKAIGDVARILDRVVETVELNQNILEKRIQHVEHISGSSNT